MPNIGSTQSSSFLSLVSQLSRFKNVISVSGKPRGSKHPPPCFPVFRSVLFKLVLGDTKVIANEITNEITLVRNSFSLISLENELLLFTNYIKTNLMLPIHDQITKHGYSWTLLNWTPLLSGYSRSGEMACNLGCPPWKHTFILSNPWCPISTQNEPGNSALQSMVPRADLSQVCVCIYVCLREQHRKEHEPWRALKFWKSTRIWRPLYYVQG